MNSFSELNNSLCRLCLRFENSKKMVSLLDKNEDGKMNYGEAIYNFTKVVIKKQDPLPKLMCLNCLHLLKQAVYFKLQCEHTDRCFKNIANSYSENGDVKRAIAEFAMLNFYLDYKYSFSSSLKKGKSKRKRKVSNEVFKMEQTIDYDTDCSIGSERSYSENTVQVEPNENTETLHTDITISPITVNTSSTDNLKPDQNSGSVEDSEQENDKMLNMLEQMFVPKECDVPLSKIMQKCKKSPVSPSNTQSNEYIKELEEMFERKPCDRYTESSSVNTSHKEIKLKRRARRRYSTSHNQKKKKFICNICGKVLANQCTHKYHMQRHNGCRYICEHCGKGFPVLKELQIHQVCLHGTGPYLQCSLCPFKSPTKLDLMEHERIHSGERPYTCDKCGLTFRRRGIWKKHLIYHSEKKVECPQCHKKFFQRSDMLAHANNVHERVYVYLCSKCGATYAKGSTVRRHMTERHGIPREAQGKIIRVNKATGYQDQRIE